MNIRNPKISALVGLGLMAITGQALASTPPSNAPAAVGKAQVSNDGDFRNVIVRHGDLDLATSADREALKARIRQAARRACAFPDVPDYGLIRACRQAAAVKVRPQVLAAIDRANVRLADAGTPDSAR